MLVLLKKQLLRNLSGLLVVIGLAFFTVSCSVSPDQSQVTKEGSQAIAQQAVAGSPVAKYGLLKVVGNKICDQNGTAVQLRGMSMFWSQWSAPYYNASVVNNLADGWKMSIVRAAMGIESGGYLSDPNGQKNMVKTIVNAAIAKGIYVIIDWHDHNATDHTAQSRAFFKEMAQTYGNNPAVIFELYNEPTTQSWSSIKTYAEAVIGDIRSTGAQNLVIVGNPTWSQDVDKAAADPITSYANVAYTLHYYAGTHKQWLRDKAIAAMNKGIAIMITEYGTCDASGNGNLDLAESALWNNFMDQYKITSCNWSVNDKAETASAFVPGASTTGPWPDSQLTESGKFVKSYIQKNNNWGGDTGISSSTSSASVSSASTVTYAVPGKIEAENYTAMSGIQTEACGEGTLNVGWIDAGDWMDYPVNVQTSGTYTVEYRVAALNAGGKVDILVNGQTKASTTINSTGGWQTWTTVTANISLNAGKQTVRIQASGSGWNLNYINFKSGNASSTPVSSSSSSVSSKSSAATSSSGTTSSASGSYTEITAPFTFDGSGTRFWKVANIPSYINSWSGVTIKINGMDVSGLYKTPSQLPAKQNGYYYIDYVGTLSWSHIEIR